MSRGHSPLCPTGTQAAGSSANVDVAAPPGTQTPTLECFALEVRLGPSTWAHWPALVSGPHLTRKGWVRRREHGEYYCRILLKCYSETLTSCFGTKNLVNLRATKMVFQNKKKMLTVSPKWCNENDCGGRETVHPSLDHYHVLFKM